VLLFFLGFSRYYQVRYVRQDEMGQGVIVGARGHCRCKARVGGFWTRCKPHNEGQLMKINTEMSRRVWVDDHDVDDGG